MLYGGDNIAESIWEDQMFEDPNYQVKSQWPTGDQEIAIPYGDEFIKTELELLKYLKQINFGKSLENYQDFIND